ncbi:N-methyl-L-tryptophan oxidase [Alkalicoccus daliensis]|uniref:N-methyl-L-tryptophan oxidase n=1 Tax=Alkalicoccus daliensis TaxID=745820 RepID=A0A1H0JBR6_9BACI|nr:N-methyl-L-tryptophan oxidase [Alkalicoccus daliensis]SDO41094.1 N-methyl-L-tryptophan oxidase [Alkalicoccus daliensis]
MKYDVIVIGAGSMGMAAGFYLSKNGKKTLLLDAHDPPHSNGSHHGETRIIRYAYGEGEEYVPFVLRAKKLWEDLERISKKELFLQTGVLGVGRDTSGFIQNTISSAGKYSLPLEVLTAEDVHRRWPGITIPDNFIGCFEPTSGVLKCEEIIKVYEELAIESGAVIHRNSSVKDISIHEKKVTVTTEDETITAGSLIIAAGAGSGKLVSMLDLDLPLTPVRKTFAWFEAEETQYNQEKFPAFAFDTFNGTYYGFPSIQQAGLKIGRHDGGEKVNPEKSMMPFGAAAEDEGDLLQFFHQYMPDIHQLKYGKTCMYTLTPDEKFIIDTHPEYSNVAIAAGFSGHGFKFSSAVGEALSNLITSEKNEVDISPFSLKRFQR